MGNDMLIKILQEQLDVANKKNIRLNATIKSMEAHFNATIADLRKTIENHETLLKERDKNLIKANSQMRG